MGDTELVPIRTVIKTMQGGDSGMEALNRGEICPTLALENGSLSLQPVAIQHPKELGAAGYGLQNSKLHTSGRPPGHRKDVAAGCFQFAKRWPARLRGTDRPVQLVRFGE